MSDSKLWLIIAILAIILGVYLQGIYHGNEAANVIADNKWSPRDYTPKKGDCWVPPQGDPLYDEHYAEINKDNCTAFKTQSEARNVDADTRAVDEETRARKVETNTGLFGVYTILAVFVGIGFLLFKGSGG